MTKNLTLVIVGALAAITCRGDSLAARQTGGVAATAAMACAASIRGRPQAAAGMQTVRMPPACYSFDGGALGEQVTGLFSGLGTPDALSYSPGFLRSPDGKVFRGTLEVAYLFPRTLNRDLRARPVDKAHYTVLTLLTRDGTVRAGDIQSFAGLRVGDPLSRVYSLLGKPSRSNRPGDMLFYDPLPFYVGIDETTKRISGFRIWLAPGDEEQIVGPTAFASRNGNGKLVGVSLLYAGVHP